MVVFGGHVLFAMVLFVFGGFVVVAATDLSCYGGEVGIGSGVF
ncbi:hypothetical protein A2U01_0117329, partial [Trifolium medium]|nr:hypothetical protein [Trifolium medium]